VHAHHAIALVTNPKALAVAPETVHLLHDAGLGILLYTLNEQESWAEALAMGVDGIITDTPSSLDGWLADTAPGTSGITAPRASGVLPASGCRMFGSGERTD